MAENTELIKEKLDIIDFIRGYLKLDKAGRNFKGICPFHKEKTPSMMVSPDRQIWHCFGCGAGGDIFGFLMQYENIEFVEALRILADKAGVQLRQMTGDSKKYEKLYEINRIAKDFFRSKLASEAGKIAGKYLMERGMEKSTMIEFEVGVAPSEQDGLVKHLSKMGYQAPEVEAAGLAFKTDRGTYWDRFRNRIMFPINNHFGKTVGFTGRIMPGSENEKTGKYVNSPETPLFNKSKLLFAFDKTKNFIREADEAVFVEGQMDAIMAFQDGVKNVVATSGTALTEGHLSAVGRIMDNLVLAFDNDDAGRSAAERTIDLAEAADLNVKVLALGKDGAKDPADIIKESPGKFKEMLGGVVPAMEYYFDFYNVLDGDIAKKKKAIRAVLSKIKCIASPVERSHWVSQLANRSGIEETVLAAEMDGVDAKVQEVKKRVVEENADKDILKKLTRHDKIIQRLLALALLDKALGERLKKDYSDLLSENYAQVLDYILLGSKEDPDPEIRGLVNLVYLQADIVPIKTAELDSEGKEKKKYAEAEKAVDLGIEFKELIDSLKGHNHGGKKKALLEKISDAEAKGDEERLMKLLREYQDLTKS